MHTRSMIATLLALSAAATGCSERELSIGRAERRVLSPTRMPDHKAFQCEPVAPGELEPLGALADGRQLLARAGADGCRSRLQIDDGAGGTPTVFPVEAYHMSAAGAVVGSAHIVCATRVDAQPITVTVQEPEGGVVQQPARGSGGLLYRIDGATAICAAERDDGSYTAAQAIDVLPPGTAPAGTPIAYWVLGVAEKEQGAAAVIQLDVLVDSRFDPGNLAGGRPAHDGFWQVLMTRDPSSGAFTVLSRSLERVPDLTKLACENSLTCQDVGAQCGVFINGCGEPIDCGGCPDGQSCGGDGQANRCSDAACVPRTCADADADCGTITDGCGGALECGTCAEGRYCGAGGQLNQCACVPRSCEDQFLDCGAADDGCGGALHCGECADEAGPFGPPSGPPSFGSPSFGSPDPDTGPRPAGTCGGGGVTNVCGSL